MFISKFPENTTQKNKLCFLQRNMQFNDENKSWCCILRLGIQVVDPWLGFKPFELCETIETQQKQTFKGWWKGISLSKRFIHVHILYLFIYSFVVDLFHPLYKGYSVKSFHHLQAPWGDMISNGAQKGGETSPAIREMKDGWHGWQMRRCGQSTTNP